MTQTHLETTINLAFAIGKQHNHKYVTTEHLMLALLDNPEAIHVIQAISAQAHSVRTHLYRYIETTTPNLPDNCVLDLQATLGFRQVIHHAHMYAKTQQAKETHGGHVLTALLYDDNSESARLLKHKGITLTKVMKRQNDTVQNASSTASSASLKKQAMAAEDNMITQEQAYPYFTNLNQRVEDGKIDRLIGRQEELMRIIQILSLRKKNNPILIGEPGAGKTALIEGLAHAIVHQQVPGFMKNATILSLDLGSMLAGTKYRGDFEKRLQQILKSLDNFDNPIIFIDEIHGLLGAGSSSGAGLDAANLLKPLLTSGELRCMGATTFKEYRNIFCKDAALARRFQDVIIREATVDETMMILKGNRDKLEEHHSVIISEDAIAAASHLADRYINNRCLPDKAIDVLDEACAMAQINRNGTRKLLVNNELVEQVVSRISRIPCKQLSASDRDILIKLEKRLKKHIYGQEEAIQALSRCIKLSRSGLRNQKKPMGCFLFAGPTGVGKTEVALQLAEVMNVKYERIDMSEYMEKHTVSQLIGAPAGYVGYEQGGILTEKVKKNPHCVLILDEIEKAHGDIYNLLLQVMDHGKLTDNNGEEIDFRHVILIMTSNSGAQVSDRNSVGFAEQDHSESLRSDAISMVFSPEFRNRLDAIIHFKSLDKDHIQRVVDKFMTELKCQLHEQNVELVVRPSMKKWLAENGYDRKMGARPIERLIEQKIKCELADELLFGKLKSGGKVTLSSRSNRVLIDIQ